MIQATNLYKSFGDTSILQGVSFEVKTGQVAALVGPNGSGKTTTLHLLAGLATPDAGTAEIEGIDVTTHRPDAQERLAFLPQDVRFHGALTPRQVLRFYAGLRDASSERIDDLLEQVALAHAADRPCETLSGGMRQRLGVALLELADAKVVLLDEPALSLDPDWRTYLMDRLRSRADDGATVLMATHLLDVWRPVVDRILTCKEGKIQSAQNATDERVAPDTVCSDGLV